MKGKTIKKLKLLNNIKYTKRILYHINTIVFYHSHFSFITFHKNNGLPNR